MSGAKHALLVGVSAYDDPGLAQLEAPPDDVRALQEVLDDPAIGGFARVTVLQNAPRDVTMDALHELYEQRAADDLTLLYFSGHGIVDAANRFFLGVAGTRLNRLRTTAIHYRDVHELMDESRAQGQLVILDCCHAGAFAERARASTGAVVLDDDVLGTTGSGARQGSGRWILAASDATSFAFERQELVAGSKEPRLGIFTDALVEGLRNGAGPPDAEFVTSDALFAFAECRLGERAPTMRPRLWVRAGSAPLALARRRQVVRDAVTPTSMPADRHEVTLLQAELRGLTEASRRADPEVLARSLEAHLGAFAATVHRFGGNVVGSTGDGLTAVWLASSKRPDHASRACAAALAIRDGLTSSDDGYRAVDPNLSTGISIAVHTGVALVVDTRAERAYDSQVLGNVVNETAVLAAACSRYDVDIIIGERTRREGGNLATLPLGTIRLGRPTPDAPIHTLVGDTTLAVDAAFAAFATSYSQLLADEATDDDALVDCREAAARAGLAPLFESTLRRLLKADRPGPLPG